MKALVLGGCGFIGSHLTESLIKKNLNVSIFDKKNIPEFLKKKYKIEYYQGTLTDRRLIAEALKKVDIVFHLISSTVPSTSNQDPIYDIKTNLIGTINLLQEMVYNNVKKIVYLSSGGTVYGNPKFNPVNEDHSLRPISSYGIVKIAIENYIYMFQKIYGIDFIILRPSNAYGPRQGHTGIQGIIGTLLYKYLQNETINIWGDGSIVRDYIYVGDLVQLCIKSGLSNINGIFNAGSGYGVSINELISIIQKTLDIKFKINYLPARKFDVQKIILDISKTKKAFNWLPEVSIEEGIKRQWHWMVNTSKTGCIR
jgi:UDP-glucose 4-epimerase